MGQSFTKQIDELQHRQLEWVPREPDLNGGGNQGGRLVMLPYGESVLFNNLSITDTNAHMSTPPDDTKNPEGVAYDQVYAVYKTALVTSTLNQAVSLQPMFSRDKINWYQFGSSTTVPAYSGSGNPQNVIISLSTPNAYIPYVGLQATCSTAPTTGNLNGWLERLG